MAMKHREQPLILRTYDNLFYVNGGFSIRGTDHLSEFYVKFCAMEERWEASAGLDFTQTVVENLLWTQETGSFSSEIHVAQGTSRLESRGYRRGYCNRMGWRR